MVAFFDLAKAFDKVPHRGLLQKLSDLDICGQRLSLVCSYLTNRYQCVVFYGSTSQLVPVLSGVPQGSVLGPLLFLTFINNLCHIPFSSGSKLVLFANDTSLYKSIDSRHDFEAFQEDINKIYGWFTTNFLQSNAKKTKAMVISTKHNPYLDFQLHLNNQAIGRVNDIMFLGIRISAKLSWNFHIDIICKKARRIIGLIHRNFHLAPKHLCHTLYITLVCPILEYSCTTWHPLNKTLTNHSESIQRFACRVILQSWNLEHDDLLSRTSLPTLEAHHDCSTVVQVFKILAGLSSAPTVFIPHTCSDSRRYHSCMLYIPFSCLMLYQRSFFHLGPKLWNKLPENIASCVTLPAFKAAVRAIIMD